jgi:hypothetical protein
MLNISNTFALKWPMKQALEEGKENFRTLHFIPLDC